MKDTFVQIKWPVQFTELSQDVKEIVAHHYHRESRVYEMVIKLPLVITAEGMSNKMVFEIMAQNFRDPNYRQRAGTGNPAYHEEVIMISGALADQLADFFDDMAKAIEGK